MQRKACDRMISKLYEINVKTSISAMNEEQAESLVQRLVSLIEDNICGSVEVVNEEVEE